MLFNYLMIELNFRDLVVKRCNIEPISNLDLVIKFGGKLLWVRYKTLRPC